MLPNVLIAFFVKIFNHFLCFQFTDLYQSFDIENIENPDMKIEIVGIEPDNNVVNYRVILFFNDNNEMTEEEVEVRPTFSTKNYTYAYFEEKL